MKTRWFNKAMTGLALGAAAIMALPVNALACTQVWMPNTYTKEANTWYAGRAEDTATRQAKIFGVEPRHEAGFVYQSNENGDFAEGDNFQWTSDTPTYRYTYVRDHGDNGWEGAKNAYSAAGINEWGVSCSATLSTYPSSEIRALDPAVDSGVGEFNYVALALGQNKTAKDAVAFLGSLVDKYGSCSSDQLIISDAHESWMFSVVSGHQWLGFQLPEDKASVNPNMGSLTYPEDLDLSDAAKCLHSKDLVEMPKKAGVLKYFEGADGKPDETKPDIASTYARADEGAGQFSRFVIGRAYFDGLDGVDYYVSGGRILDVTDGRTLFFTPGKGDWTTTDMIRSLAARADTVTGLKKGVANTVTGVGRQDSLETHMFEINRVASADASKEDTAEATVEWLALNRDDFSLAVPSFGGLMTEVNPRYGTQDLDLTHQGGGGRDNLAEALKAGPWDYYMPYVMMDVNTICNADREQVGETVHSYIRALQDNFVTQNEEVKTYVRGLSGEAQTAAANLANSVATEQAHAKYMTLLTELRTWHNGDQKTPFVPSDYDTSTQGIKTPMTYSAEVKTPLAAADGVVAGAANRWVVLSETVDGAQVLKQVHVDADGKIQTGLQKIDGIDFVMGEDGTVQTGFVKVGDKTYYAAPEAKTGWQTIDGKDYYFGTDGVMATGKQTIDGKNYLFDANGVSQTGWQKDGDKTSYYSPDMATGWKEIDGKTYYFGDDGAMKTGITKVGDKTYNLGDDGAMKTGVYTVDGKLMAFGEDGAQATGWVTVDETPYYLPEDGSKVDPGWQKMDGTWYLFGENNAAKTDWQAVGGKWYLMDEDGSMLSGWQKDGDTWYLLGGAEDGAMKTGWQKVGGTWYLLDGSGAMKTGWQAANGKWYLLGGADDGAMKAGWQKVGGTWYLLGGADDGAMKSGWQLVNGKWYYLGGSNDGAMKTGWQAVNGSWYLLGGADDGAMKTGWQIDNGKLYLLRSDGSMVSNTRIGGFTIGADGAVRF
ncbi:MAG: hypothetical protein HFJ63_01140 [Atopobiaceae bacterium]|nr:hypothetical protein [Atopobiaceae bacterium]